MARPTGCCCCCRPALFSLPLLLSFLVVPSLAVHYVFDENLFSKDTWHLWKLESAIDGLNPSTELLGAPRDVPYPDLAHTSHNSLDGPGARKLGLPKYE